jgi:isopentenyldiphosphate isomerase
VEEFIDEVDRSGKIIATHSRALLKKQMFMHRVALIIPKAPNNKILLSRRAKDKHPFPDRWCCAVGGKVSHGETEETAALREMKEEIGKSLALQKVKEFVYDEQDYKAIFTVFTTKTAMASDDLVLDPEEIQYSTPFSKEEVRKMIKESPSSFAPTFIAAIKETIDLL